MNTKTKAGQALKTFVMDFSVPEEHTVDRSKEKNVPGNGFMKWCQRNDISLTKTDLDRPNQTPEEGVIMEI